MEQQESTKTTRPNSDWSPFLKRVNQYKEVVLLIVFFLGGLFWIYSYFATKQQVEELHCLINVNITLIETRMNLKFYLDELAEKSMIAERILAKESLSPVEQLSLLKVKAEIDVFKYNLADEKKEYDLALEKMKQGACRARK